MPASDLYDLGADVLAAVVGAYADADVDLPDRRYVTAGLPVDDCEQAVVWLGRLFTGLPHTEVTDPEHVGFARTLEMGVRVTRCVPAVDEQGNAPPASEIDAAGAAVATDLWVLPQGLIARRAAGEFLAACQNLVIGNCVAFEWSGGLGGAELTIRVQVDSSL